VGVVAFRAEGSFGAGSFWPSFFLCGQGRRGRRSARRGFDAPLDGAGGVVDADGESPEEAWAGNVSFGGFADAVAERGGVEVVDAG